jgi:hypothetical protein
VQPLKRDRDSIRKLWIDFSAIIVQKKIFSAGVPAKDGWSSCFPNLWKLPGKL